MSMTTYPSFRQAIKDVGLSLINAPIVKTETWQAISTEHRPELATHEDLFVSFKVPLRHRILKKYVHDIQPDLPWADEHFLERVSGIPYNPPPSEVRWPHATSNDSFKTSGDKFSHTYPERFWPKFANEEPTNFLSLGHQGIRFRYGDLNDLVDLLRRQPFTRQAFLPIFFPEDTGAHHGQRIPCTLGYHFIRRGDHLHIVYYLRSCDYHRHFHNDIYFTVRLLLWVLDQLDWPHVMPGTYVMHITSLHLFVNDARELRKQL